MTGATFERGAFEAALDELGSMLGDLWGVDEAIKLGNADEVRDAGGMPTAYGKVGVDVGRKHPFRMTVFWSTPGDQGGSDPFGSGLSSGGIGANSAAAQAHVDELAARGREWGRSVAESLRSSVQDIVRPIPATFEDAVETLRGEVINPLSTQIADNFAHLEGSLGDWDGQAAEQFNDYFYTQVEAAVRNQIFTAEAVCVGLAGSKAIVHLGQHSLMGLVVGVRDALDAQLLDRQATHETSGFSTSDWLVLGATFLALAGAIPSGGGTLAAYTGLATGASALVNFASTQVEDGETSTFSVASAEDTMEDLFEQLGTIRTRLRSHWDELEGSLTELRTLVEEAEASKLLYPPRPGRMTDGQVPPHAWHHESAPR